jgi:RNA polymerase sigma factor (sigma-70 family)
LRTLPISESNLVAGLKSHEREAFEYLYDNYSGALFGKIISIVQKEEIAEEVLQDVFVKIWDKIDSYDAAKGRLFTWMINIARNLAIDKTRSREMGMEMKTNPIEKFVSGIERKNPTEQQTDAIGIKDFLKQLPEDELFIVEHLYFKGYTHSEISEEFKIPLGTVKTRVRTAIKRLQTLIHVD